MGVIDVRVNGYAGCDCDTTLRRLIWSKEIREFTGEIREMLFEKTFFFFSRK